MATLTLKLKQIVDAMPALAKFANTDPKKEAEGKDGKDADKVSTDNKATAKEIYRVGKLVKKMNAEYQDYIEARNTAVKKYGEKKKIKDAAGNEVETTAVKDEHQDAFQAEIDDLLDEDKELEGVDLIPWSYFEKLMPAPSIAADLCDIMEEPK